MDKQEKYRRFRFLCREYVDRCSKCPLRNSKICVRQSNEISEQELDAYLKIMEKYCKKAS